MKVIEFLKKIDYQEYIGDPEKDLTRINNIENKHFTSSDLLWLKDSNIEVLKSIKNATVICSELCKSIDYDNSLSLIIVKNPRQTFKLAIDILFPEEPFSDYISTTAKIDSNSIIHRPVYIGENVVIGKNCEIGPYSSIGHNTVLFDTVVEEHVHIGNNCTIGCPGFGYTQNYNGDFEKIRHLGRVLIKSKCEIANNVCIDKAVIGQTILEQNVKIDNLCHIAHGVTIGRNSMVIANSMIAGSVNIGENVWVAPSSSIKNGLKIQKNSLIGLGAVVIRDVKDGDTVVGNPARSITQK